MPPAPSAALPFTLTLPEPLYQALGQAAHDQGRSMAHVTRQALAAYLALPASAAHAPHGNRRYLSDTERQTAQRSLRAARAQARTQTERIA